MGVIDCREKIGARSKVCGKSVSPQRAEVALKLPQHSEEAWDAATQVATVASGRVESSMGRADLFRCRAPLVLRIAVPRTGHSERCMEWDFLRRAVRLIRGLRQRPGATAPSEPVHLPDEV